MLLLVPSMCPLSLAVVLHSSIHTFFLNKMFTKSATALRHNHVARFFLCCSSNPAARSFRVARQLAPPHVIHQGKNDKVLRNQDAPFTSFLNLLCCSSTPATVSPLRGTALRKEWSVAGNQAAPLPILGITYVAPGTRDKLRHDDVARFPYAAPPTPQHVFLMLLPRLATSSPAPDPNGNASTTAVHGMARMARAEALREGSAVPLLSLPQVSTASPTFASFHVGNPRFA